ncbi:hypothetical protein B0H13DRAFT_1851014 [Mycena leptocephala]|nr:hypothetical protein B0H13DRAFT_1851014 [Mycena leptocephala]
MKEARVILKSTQDNVLNHDRLYAYRVWLSSGYHHGVLGYLVVHHIHLESGRPHRMDRRGVLRGIHSNRHGHLRRNVLLPAKEHGMRAGVELWCICLTNFRALSFVSSLELGFLNSNFHCRTAYLRARAPSRVSSLYLLTRPAPAPLYSATSQSHVWRARSGKGTPPPPLSRSVYLAVSTAPNDCITGGAFPRRTTIPSSHRQRRWERRRLGGSAG